MIKQLLLLLVLLIKSCRVRAFRSSPAYALQHGIQQHHPNNLKIEWWRLYNNDVQQQQSSPSTHTPTILLLSNDSSLIEFNNLMVMDVVLFQRNQEQQQKQQYESTKLELGAVQENGNIAVLSTWTLESAYETSNNDMMEFVVDEHDLFPGLSCEEVTVLKVLEGDQIGYGSRQVGGGKGLGNPHGEESEIVYYVERNVVEGRYCIRSSEEGGGEEEGGVEIMKIELIVNPDLEHLW